MRIPIVGLAVVAASTLAMTASPSSAASTGHSTLVEVVCSSSGFTVDANALRGQIKEVTAFYGATGIACSLYDSETGALLFDPTA